MIYCVEDDEAIRELTLYALRASGFTAEGFSDGNALFRELESGRPELILLDIMLPGMDGVEILKKIRENPETRQIPVIMATAKGTEFDKVSCLDQGADDYLTKPFGMMEMISRVRAVLRRTGKSDFTPALRAGEIEINQQAHTVVCCGKRIELTLKEYELLNLFLQYPGMVFSREKLLERVWGTDFYGETRTVDVHIGTLRTKLGSCGNYIQTVRGVGYRLEVNA